MRVVLRGQTPSWKEEQRVKLHEDEEPTQVNLFEILVKLGRHFRRLVRSFWGTKEGV